MEYLAVIAASVLWSVNPAIISRFRGSISPLTFVGLRALAAIPFYLAVGGANVPRDLSTVLVVLASALLGPGVGDAAYTRSIQLVGGSLAVVVSYTYMFVAQALASVVLGERLSIATVASSVIALTGVLIASGTSRGGGDLRRGLALASTASIAWASALTLLKIALSSAPIPAIMLLRLAFILTVFLPLGLVSEGVPSARSLKRLVFAALATSFSDLIVGMYLFAYSISVLGVASSVVPTALTPVLTLITTRVLARERVPTSYVLGASLVSIAILVAVLSPP